MRKAFFGCGEKGLLPQKIFATQDFAFCNSPVTPPFDSAHEFLANSERRYGWISSVQRNCHMAIALIATETAKRKVSLTVIFDGPLPVSRRNIQGRRIMA